MRKQNKVVLWPAYFDSSKTRLQGRRIPKNAAVISPRLDELQRATEKCGFQPEIVADARHPSTPWQKTGLILVLKSASKAQIIRRIAKELFNMRTQNQI